MILTIRLCKSFDTDTASKNKKASLNVQVHSSPAILPIAPQSDNNTSRRRTPQDAKKFMQFLLCFQEHLRHRVVNYSVRPNRKYIHRFQSMFSSQFSRIFRVFIATFWDELKWNVSWEVLIGFDEGTMGRVPRTTERYTKLWIVSYSVTVLLLEVSRLGEFSNI